MKDERRKRQPQTHHQALYQFAAEHVGLFKHARIGRDCYSQVSCTFSRGPDGQVKHYRLLAIVGQLYHDFVFARDGRVVRETIRHRPSP